MIINEVTTKELQTIVARDSEVISLQNELNLVKDEIIERKEEEKELYKKGWALRASYEQGRDVMNEIKMLNGKILASLIRLSDLDEVLNRDVLFAQNYTRVTDVYQLIYDVKTALNSKITRKRVSLKMDQH